MNTVFKVVMIAGLVGCVSAKGSLFKSFSPVEIARREAQKNVHAKQQRAQALQKQQMQYLYSRYKQEVLKLTAEKVRKAVGIPQDEHQEAIKMYSEAFTLFMVKHTNVDQYQNLVAKSDSYLRAHLQEYSKASEEKQLSAIIDVASKSKNELIKNTAIIHFLNKAHTFQQKYRVSDTKPFFEASYEQRRQDILLINKILTVPLLKR